MEGGVVLVPPHGACVALANAQVQVSADMLREEDTDERRHVAVCQ